MNNWMLLGWVILGLVIVKLGLADEGFVITNNAAKPTYRILLISTQGCQPCELLKQQIRQHLTENKYAEKFEYLDYEHDEDAKKYAISRAGVVSFPQVIVIKVDGSIKAVHFGYTDGEDLGWFLYSALPKNQKPTMKQTDTYYNRIRR